MSVRLCFSSWGVDAQPYDPNSVYQPVPRRFIKEPSFQAIEEAPDIQISAQQSNLAPMNAFASRPDVTRIASSAVVGQAPAGDGYNADPSPGGASIGGNTALYDAPSTRRSRFHS